MKVILNFTLVPIDVGLSLSKYVAACERILREYGLSFQLHANGTNVEGEWEEVFLAVKRCHEVIHEMGARRIFTAAQFGTRTDREQSMNEKVKSVREKLEKMNDI
jgi:uncharacterized protein (TIGR00106 family)